MTKLVVVATVTEQGVFMGDHGQDVTTAAVVLPGETVEELVERVLTKPIFMRDEREPILNGVLNLRVAVIPEPKVATEEEPI